MKYFRRGNVSWRFWAVHDERHSKAVCTALRLLGRMGSRLVKRGDGYFISTEPEKNQSQIYLYNYVHYDMLYRYRHAVNISRTDRYRVFNMGEIRTFQ